MIDLSQKKRRIPRGHIVLYSILVITVCVFFIKSQRLQASLDIKNSALDNMIADNYIDARNTIQQGIDMVEGGREMIRQGCDLLPIEERTKKDIYYCGE